jgi:hypothetical protein
MSFSPLIYVCCGCGGGVSFHVRFSVMLTLAFDARLFDYSLPSPQLFGSLFCLSLCSFPFGSLCVYDAHTFTPHP